MHRRLFLYIALCAAVLSAQPRASSLRCDGAVPQIQFAAGEQFSYMMGVGFSVNDRVTLSATMQAFYITDFLVRKTAVPGSLC